MSGLNQSTALYLEFWSSIRNTNDNQEDVAKLNDLGTKINKVVEEIKNNFDRMQKLKHNDELIIRFYSDFLLDILNEKEKGLYYKNRLNEIEGSNEDLQITSDKNVDLDHLLSDEFQFIMISAETEKPNIIKKVTTGICSLFGYAKDELIGQPIDILMPEQYQKLHRKILMNKIDEYKKFVANNLHSKTKKVYKSTFKEIYVVAKNKSKYLIPITIKSNLITSADESEIYFIGKINKVVSDANLNLVNNNPANNLSNKNNITTTDSVCYILTDNNFVIQNFSPNSIFLMGLKAKYNGNLDITRHVKELYEDPELNRLENSLLKNMNNLENEFDDGGFVNSNLIISINQSKKIFFNSKYKSSLKISWRYPAKLKEKQAFMAKIIGLNENAGNKSVTSKKNSDKSISSRTGGNELSSPPRSPRDNQLANNDFSIRNSKLSNNINIKFKIDNKDMSDQKKKKFNNKDIDFSLYIQEQFLMSVSDIFLLGNLEGFVFKFETSFIKNHSGVSNSSNKQLTSALKKPQQEIVIPSNLNLNFNFNSNKKNPDLNLHLTMSDTLTHNDSIKAESENLNANKLHEIKEEEPITINLNKIPTFSENINNENDQNKDMPFETSRSRKNDDLKGSFIINNPLSSRNQFKTGHEINPNNLSVKKNLVFNSQPFNESISYNTDMINEYNEDDKSKDLGATNWIKNIKKRRELKKKQIKEMKELKIDKNYIPELYNEFHLDPKEGIYRINPKNPENFVEVAKIEAENKIKFKNNENSSQEESDSNYSSSNSDSNSISYSDYSISNKSDEEINENINEFDENEDINNKSINKNDFLNVEMIPNLNVNENQKNKNLNLLKNTITGSKKIVGNILLNFEKKKTVPEKNEDNLSNNNFSNRDSISKMENISNISNDSSRERDINKKNMLFINSSNFILKNF